MIRMAYVAGAVLASVPTVAFADASSGHKDQARGEQEIPICSHKIGTLAIVPPDKEWWRELNLGSPEAIIKIFAARPAGFSLVTPNRRLAARRWGRRLPARAGWHAGRNTARGQARAPIISPRPTTAAP